MKNKKLLCIAIVCVICLLCACGASEKAKQADADIASFLETPITIDSGKDIAFIEAEIAELSDSDKSHLSNMEGFEAAKTEYDSLAQDAISEAEASISGIGEITLNSRSAVNSARKKYEDLPEELQQRVSNVSALEQAEAEFSAMCVKNAESLIDAIGEVTLESKDAVNLADSAYKKLTEDEKKQVKNAQTLEEGKNKLNELEEAAAAEAAAAAAAEKEKELNSALAGMTTENDEFKGITYYFPKRFPEYIDSRTNVMPYIAKETSTDRKIIFIRYNYAGDDWIFFKRVIFLIDGEKYEKTFDYFDINHDVGRGVVGEWYDDYALADDIEMLRKIAASTETNVRFEGDTQNKDITIGDKDKAAIRDTLTVYESL